jgi:hypothetical protein
MRPNLSVVAALLFAAPCLAQSPATGQPAVPPPVIATAAGGGAPAASKSTLVGITLADAQHTPFLEFFHFAQSSVVQSPSHPEVTVDTFDTTGSFKGQAVLLLATKTGSDSIGMASLIVHRDFIDNPATTMFARDVVKSFIDAAPGIPSAEVTELRAEIWTSCAAGVQQFTSNANHTGFDPKSCINQAAPSPGYLAYQGKQDNYRISYSSGYLDFRNVKREDNTSLLFIALGTPDTQ